MYLRMTSKPVYQRGYSNPSVEERMEHDGHDDKYDSAHGGCSLGNHSGGFSGSHSNDSNGDVTMSDSSQDNSQQRCSPYARPAWKGDDHSDSGTKGKRGPGGRGGKHRSAWYQVMIPHSKKYDKKGLLTALQNICSVSFIPVQYHLDQNKVHFFVDDSTTARALKKCSHKITDSDGYRVEVRVKPSAPPSFLRSDLKPEDMKDLKDGNDLTPPISVDVEMPTATPKCKDSNLCSYEDKKLIQQFLTQYYSIFDAADRQPLLNAYHDGATFSVSTPDSTQNASKSSLGEGQKDSQNPRCRLLLHTRQNVVALLSRMPKTQHDLASFHIDVNTCTNTSLSFTVSGLFKEVAVDGKSGKSTVAFSRVFTTVPAGKFGMCIINDQLSIRKATTEEIRQPFEAPASTSSSSPVPTLTAPQQEMLTAFSQQSCMNLEWSRKCLQDNEWDFKKASQIFTHLKTEGKIPEVAFIK